MGRIAIACLDMSRRAIQRDMMCLLETHSTKIHDSEWQEVMVEVTIPPKTQEIRVAAHASGKNGKAFFDDFTLEFPTVGSENASRDVAAEKTVEQ